MSAHDRTGNLCTGNRVMSSDSLGSGEGLLASLCSVFTSLPHLRHVATCVDNED